MVPRSKMGNEQVIYFANPDAEDEGACRLKARLFLKDDAQFLTWLGLNGCLAEASSML
jgi:hypothetical protein